MLDVGTANAPGEDDADLAVFVDRLAAAGADRVTSDARAQILRALAAGSTPPGLRRLAEALAASVSELPPPPRRPEDASVVAAMRDNALVVLEDFDPAAAAGAVAALLADGRRVVVTAATPAELAAVRGALPAAAADRALTHLPGLPPAELRELRRLLATSTPERRARAGQELPPESALPPVAEVAELCARADQSGETRAGAWVVPALLAGLDAERLATVASVAHSAERSLSALQPRAEHEWEWRLLSELVYSRQLAAFDRIQEDTAHAVAAVGRAHQGPHVGFVDTPPPGAVQILRRYHDFLEAGGRTRAVFRSSAQREVQPVLDRARVGVRMPETEEDVRLVIEHLELVERRERIEAGCLELGLPAPRNEHELTALADVMVNVAAAARAVGALRHSVLFLAPDSPLSVPDVESAAEIAGAILDFADHGSAAEATGRLDAMADAVAGPGFPTAPEHEQAVAALRARDANAYAAAFEALGAARRDGRDEALCVALLQRLAQGAPRLAAAWAALVDTDPAALGLASFVPAAPLLSALPQADTADVVLVLGAAGLGVERLLLTAVAPRMIAVVGPGEHTDPPTLVSVLQRASALVIRGRSNVGGAGGTDLRCGGPRLRHPGRSGRSLRAPQRAQPVASSRSAIGSAPPEARCHPPPSTGRSSVHVPPLSWRSRATGTADQAWPSSGYAGGRRSTMVTSSP